MDTGHMVYIEQLKLLIVKILISLELVLIIEKLYFTLVYSYYILTFKNYTITIIAQINYS